MKGEFAFSETDAKFDLKPEKRETVDPEMTRTLFVNRLEQQVEPREANDLTPERIVKVHAQREQASKKPAKYVNFKFSPWSLQTGAAERVTWAR
ncbi:MAG: hypothetical protein RIC14_12570 [Filomicrobium sp.]